MRQPQFSLPQPQHPLQQITGAVDLLRKLELLAAPGQQYHHPQTWPQSYVGESSTGAAGAGKNYGMGGRYIPPYAFSIIKQYRHPQARPQSFGMSESYGAAGAGQNYGMGNRYIPPYAFSIINASHFGKHSPRHNAAPAAPMTVAQVRSRLLGRPMEPELLASPVASAHVARLLEDGDEQVRQSVLATFKRDVRCFMESSAHRQAVLLALVRACMWRLDELQDIIIAVYHTNGFLSGVKHNHGLAALKELVTSVALAHNNHLVRPIGEPLFFKCPELLEHCFITMPYGYSKILIRFAIVHYAELLDPVGLGVLMPTQSEDIASWLLRQRARLDHQARAGFDYLLLLVAWIVWKERNNRTFQRNTVRAQELFRRIMCEAENWVEAGFRSLASSVAFWSQNLSKS